MMASTESILSIQAAIERGQMAGEMRRRASRQKFHLKRPGCCEDHERHDPKPPADEEDPRAWTVGYRLAYEKPEHGALDRVVAEALLAERTHSETLLLAERTERAGLLKDLRDLALLLKRLDTKP